MVDKANIEIKQGDILKFENERLYIVLKTNSDNLIVHDAFKFTPTVKIR